MRDRLSHAAQQLKPYTDQGLQGTVVLESDDIALVSHWDLLAALAAVWGDVRPGGVIDETFVARTYLTPPHIYPAQVGDRVFPAITAELVAYMQAQEPE